MIEKAIDFIKFDKKDNLSFSSIKKPFVCLVVINKKISDKLRSKV